MTDARGEVPDPAVATRLVQTLRAGDLDAPILAPTEPRWARLRYAAAPGADIRDRFRGALIGGAIGDAMGRPNEGVWPSEARERRIRAFQPWPGWRSGPKETITDDTQMTMWLAEAILGGSHEPRAANRGSGKRSRGRRAGGWGKLAAGGWQRAADAEAGSGQPAGDGGLRAEVSESPEARGQRSEIGKN